MFYMAYVNSPVVLFDDVMYRHGVLLWRQVPVWPRLQVYWCL